LLAKLFDVPVDCILLYVFTPQTKQNCIFSSLYLKKKIKKKTKKKIITHAVFDVEAGEK